MTVPCDVDAEFRTECHRKIAEQLKDRYTPEQGLLVRYMKWLPPHGEMPLALTYSLKLNDPTLGTPMRWNELK